MATAAHGFDRVPTDFAPLMGDVAYRLLGEPNRTLSNARTLRWGTHGSLKVDLEPGVFHDKEANQGGGVLDLIMREQRCDKRAAVEWLASEGLIEADPVIRPQFGEGRSPATIFYDYADADGVIAYRVERRGKGHVPPFLQHGPDGHGGYHAAKGCMAGVPRLPYRLPELLAAPADAIVFVVEGEKDADRLAALGLIATTNSEGAGKFRAELAPHFAGRRVAIIPDNDQPGRDHAVDVAGKLAGIAAMVVTIELPSLPPKGDVSDALDRGLTVDALRSLAATALATAEQQARPETFPIADLAAWAETAPEPKAFLMAGCVPLGEVTLFTGAGGTNKSTFGLQLCTASAAGLPMLGTDVRQGPSLYITAEDEGRENHWRSVKIAHALGADLSRLVGKLHVVSLRGRLNNELATFDAEGRLHVAPAYKLLRATIEATGSRLVVLDNVAHLFTGNENDRGQVTAFVNLIYQLCRDLGCTVVLIGHPNKGGDTYSGSTAWLNAVRSQIVLEYPEDCIDPDQRVLKLGKANYARTDRQITFRWHDFALMRDEDMAPSMSAEIAANAQANHDNDLFLRCLDERNRQGRAVSESKASRTYAPKEFSKMAESKRIGVARLEAAMDRLFRINAIERGVVGRHKNEGKDMIGVRRTVDDLPDDVPMAPSDDVPMTPPMTPMAHTPYTTYMGGAASGAAAPPTGHAEPRRQGGSSRVLF